MDVWNPKMFDIEWFNIYLYHLKPTKGRLKRRLMDVVKEEMKVVGVRKEDGR